MNQFTKSTVNRLEGYNSPPCDNQHKMHHPKYGHVKSVLTATIGKPRKSRSYRAACIETLIKYRTYVSHNDVALHHRYKVMMEAANLIPNQFDPAMSDAEKRRWYLYSHASLFRELLYYQFYDRAAKAINAFTRGESLHWQEDQYLYLMITPDTFMLHISLNRAFDEGVF